MLFQMLLGHCVGDYLLQNNWMALNKSKSTLQGWLACTVHSIVYTLSVCTVMWKWDWWWVAAVFLSHFPIDRFGLIDKYMGWFGKWNISGYFADTKDQAWSPEIAMRAAFTAFIYAVCDNTVHIMLMYYVLKLMGQV